MKYLSQCLTYNKFPINTVVDSDDVIGIIIPPLFLEEVVWCCGL